MFLNQIQLIFFAMIMKNCATITVKILNRNILLLRPITDHNFSQVKNDEKNLFNSKVLNLDCRYISYASLTCLESKDSASNNP